MLKRISFAGLVIVASAVAASCGGTRSVTRTNEAERAEAARAFNDMVRGYFTNDCSGYRALYTPQIKVINPYLDTLFDSASILADDSFCDRFGLWTAGLVSFDDYNTRFEPAVYSSYEFLNPDSLVSPRDSTVFARSTNSRTVMRLLAQYPGGITDRDYLVIGDVARSNDASGGLGAPFIHVLRKTDEGWRVFAVLP